MIEIKKENVNLIFGDKAASISVTTNTSENELILRNLISECKIGANLTNKDGELIPSVILQFSKIESIDVVIRCLELIRHRMRYPYGSLPLAC